MDRQLLLSIALGVCIGLFFGIIIAFAMFSLQIEGKLLIDKDVVSACISQCALLG